MDRLTEPATVRPTADLVSGAAAAGAALNPASARLAAAQRMDIDQRRDGAGIGELSFDGWGRPESKGIVRLPRARREMLPINTGCPGNGARKPATKLSVGGSLLAVPATTATAVVVPGHPAQNCAHAR